MRYGFGFRYGMGGKSLAAAALVASLVGIGSGTVARFEGQQVISATGAGFDPSVTLYADGIPLTTTYISSSACTAILPRTYLWEVGTVAILAKNATTAASSSRPYTVTQPTYIDSEWRLDMGVTLAAGKVQVLANQSGVGTSARNDVQLTGAAQPTYVAADPAYNNKPTMAYAGAQFLRSSGTFASPAFPATSFRYFVVGNITSAGGLLLDGDEFGPRAFIQKLAANTMRMRASGGTNADYVVADTTKGVFVADFAVTPKFAKSTKTFTTGSTLTSVTTPTGHTLGASNGGLRGC